MSKKYNNLDGLRTLAAIGVLCMHIYANIGFRLENSYIVHNIISQMGVCVQLFFILSGFAMCCGYYEKIKKNQISLYDFYNKRYFKILPFFAVLVIMDLGVSLLAQGNITLDKIYEAFADLTLMFGFYATKNMTVIGVGWTLGVIFGFYILFPFFVYLIWTKKRAWFMLIVTTIIAYICNVYFGVNGNLTFKWMYLFVAGGLIYLYRTDLEVLLTRKWMPSVLVILGFLLVFVVNFQIGGATGNLFRILLGFSMMVVGAIGRDCIILSNPFTKWVSGISLEVYLSHMLVYRVIEKIGLISFLGKTLMTYIIVCVLTFVGTCMVAMIFQWVEMQMVKK